MLGKVVTALVGRINKTFDARQLPIGRPRSAGGILCVPKLKVREVLLHHGPLQTCQ